MNYQNTEFPTTLPLDLSIYPKLDREQAGHIRHIHNLVSQIDGEWHHFGGEGQQQEWDDAYRYQLATMAYAIGVTHYHRLPALRGVFKSLLRKVIHKMLLRDVWGYWFVTSHGGKLMDPDLKELRKPWADPVLEENIMYSGHLLLMTSLYGMLFDDDEFEKNDSLVFRWNPLWWGLGPEEFSYSNRSLQDVIFKQMERNDWVGVCCEPNAVFVVCNQFPLVAMRYNDSRDGTKNIEPVLQKYRAALEAKGMIGPQGLHASCFRIKQKQTIPAWQAAHTAWANAFMNTWNSTEVRSLYDKQMLGCLVEVDGKTRLQQSSVTAAFRRLVLEEGEPNDATTLSKAQHSAKTEPPSLRPYQMVSWGCFMMMLSELGKTKELDDLLSYADSRLNPTWENGGLFYPRNDAVFDDENNDENNSDNDQGKIRNLIHMEPHSGNSGIAYGRLNVSNGQKQMFDHPWTHDLLASRPYIDDIDLDSNLDFLRGCWDQSQKALIITVRPWRDELCTTFSFTAKNLAPESNWAVYVGNELARIENVTNEEGEIKVENLEIRAGEVLDVVIMAL